MSTDDPFTLQNLSDVLNVGLTLYGVGGLGKAAGNALFGVKVPLLNGGGSSTSPGRIKVMQDGDGRFYCTADDALEGATSGGIVTKNGIKIEGFTKHGVDRAIGDGSKRAGVKTDSILDALKDPLKINDVVTDNLGRDSQRFIGKTAEVVVNPNTGKIISVNPTSSSKAEKLIREMGGVK